jgi:ubiquinone/menaquinone biosynthesis C-methylase UbiE
MEDFPVEQWRYLMDYKNNPIIDHNIQMYDTYYQKPDWWFRFRYDTQVKRKTCLHLLKHVGRPLHEQRVLEIGFGSGSVLFCFDRSCEIYGLELSHSAVSQAEQKAGKLGYKDFRFGIVESDLLPYPDEYFDVIIASHVIEHVRDDNQLLQEIRRTLRKDGNAVILIPINENYEDLNHMHRYTSEIFMALVTKNLFLPIHVMENELLFHFVEKFYFEEYSKRWRIRGPIIAALFNFPTAILPFWMYQSIDKMMIAFGWKPRQLACILTRTENNSKLSNGSK